MGLYLGRLISVGGVKNRQLTAGHYTFAYSLPWHGHEIETRLELTLLCFVTNLPAFLVQSVTTVLFQLFANKSMIMIHLHVKNRKVCNKNKVTPKPRQLLKTWPLSTRLYRNEGDCKTEGSTKLSSQREGNV